MVAQVADLLEERFNIPPQRTEAAAHFLLVLIAAALFALCCTLIIALDDIFLRFNNTANLGIGRVPTEDIIAREEGVFISAILTEQERTNALAQVQTVFSPADPSVARRQRDLSEKILNYIDNVRADSHASLEQQVADIQAITSLQLDEDKATIEVILQLPDESWAQVRNEITLVLERVMSDEIRAADLSRAREQLPNQVSLRLTEQQSHIVTEITSDLIRVNTFENPEQTAINQAEALAKVEDQQRHFITGQIVAPAGQRIDALSFEALQELGLLAQTGNRGARILRALLASALVTLLLLIYIRRFEAQLLSSDSANLALIATLFLVALATMRAFGSANIYLMPAAALGIVYVALSTPNLAIIAAIGFAFLSSMLSRSPSLEIASLVAAGNIAAILTLRNAGRLNNYFLAGLFVGLANAAVVAIFALQIGFQTNDAYYMLQAFFSGLLIVPTASFGVMYVLSVSLNLATPFRLMDLSQPSKPLLQRLLREAPGTYQHSLQVANLAEQAAQAIGADTQMTHVAALYHDIGKMSNPFFFTENQLHIQNPHDALDDPYRSADIIINHVIEGDQIAKKFNLPNRIREFIREHHGTTQVYVFYQRALVAAGDENGIDPAEFSYPGPIPQSRETAILMMADSCESAARAVQPQTNQEIAELVHNIIEGKRNSGQLDDSNLTLNELRMIEDTFIDIFRGLFHPRLDYAKAVQQAPHREPKGGDGAPKISDEPAIAEPIAPPLPPNSRERASESDAAFARTADADAGHDAPDKPFVRLNPQKAPESSESSLIDDDEPLADVPVLPKRNGNRSQTNQPARRADEMD
ncbi:MAG: HDIG domain-containing protein [Chloroflexi bacterium]|nr:HDIG domain-containing protein [Chloroflexota bacterium]